MFWLQAITSMPNASPIRATCAPSRPSPITPSVRPASSKPTVCCQPPSRSARSSAGMLRASARISAHVSSAVWVGVPPVPATVMPSSRAASMSIAAFPIPDVTSSLRFGSRASRSRGNGVRSRMAMITSNGSRCVDVVVVLGEDDDLGVEAVPVGEPAGDVLVVVEDRDAGHEPPYQGSASTAAWSAAEP